MGRIFCLMGKSSSGKDTIREALMNSGKLGLREIVPYTTRPIRVGETDGVDYHFVTEEDLARLEAEGKVIELRAYNTVHGIWKYFTADDGQIDPDSASYLIVGTLEAYVKLRDYFGPEQTVPVYIEVDPGERLERALRRERSQANPRYAEMCRRFLADEEDFSPEKLEAAGIDRIFENKVLEDTIGKISDFILSEQKR